MSPPSHPHYLGHSRDLTLSISLVLLSLELALPRVSSVELALYISSSIYPYICLSLYISRDLSIFYLSIYLDLSSICIYFSILPSGSHSLDSFIYLYPWLDISFCQSTFLALSIDISLSLSLSLTRSHSLDHSLKLWISLSISLYLVLSFELNFSTYLELHLPLYLSLTRDISQYFSRSLFNIYLFLMLSISC